MTPHDYALAMLAEDVVISVLARRVPLALSAYASRTGVSELPPLGRPFDREAWARRVIIDDGALSTYGEAVGHATNAFVADVPPGDTACVVRGLLRFRRRRGLEPSVAAP